MCRDMVSHRTPLTEEARQLASNNLGLARKLVNEIKERYHLEYDDAFQIACMGLLRGCRTYDPRKAALSTHVYLSIRNYASNWARDHSTLIRTPVKHYGNPKNVSSLSVDGTFGGVSLESVPSHYGEPLLEDYRFLYEAIAKLAARERQVILYLLEDRPQKEIAVLLKIRPPNVSVIAGRARQKLRKLLQEAV
ncbi:MAG: sigma-70 family RNA polymerase sigma factor [Stenomitos frigidus ULC029]